MSNESANKAEELITDKELDELVAIFSKPRIPSLLTPLFNTSSEIGSEQQADIQADIEEAKENNSDDDDWDNVGAPVSRGNTAQERAIGPSPHSNDSSPTSPSQEPRKLVPRSSAPASSRRLDGKIVSRPRGSYPGNGFSDEEQEEEEVIMPLELKEVEVAGKGKEDPLTVGFFSSAVFPQTGSSQVPSRIVPLNTNPTRPPAEPPAETPAIPLAPSGS